MAAAAGDFLPAREPLRAIWARPCRLLARRNDGAVGAGFGPWRRYRHMRPTRVLLAALAAALATAAPAAAAPFFDAAKLPAPIVTGKELADSVGSFAEAH